ncbi:MAG: MATE family efflux transporter [Calditrichaeota bacterium]|nr:MAG: MATE family efflux transporter [Calditrichota bacterium]
MKNTFIQRWNEESGYGEVLRIAFPLILSTSSWSLQHFIDRMFLTWYSPEAIAASMPAGLVNWTLVSIFVGTAAYVNTFVAQYYGARNYERIGSSVWQGLYLSLLASLVAILFVPLAQPIFSLFGHPEGVKQLEVVYFLILLIGAPFLVINNAISSFFTGLGKTWMVMWVNFFSTGVNLFLDYLMIFGKWGFPEMGIAGAAWATVISVMVTSVVLFLLMSQAHYRKKYSTLKNWKFERELFLRLLKYGLPSGFQFFLEIMAFTLFILLVGKIGVIELAASNIAFNINTLAFLPMYGMTIAVSTVVGQRLGENRPELAEKATWSAFHLAFIYFFVLGLGYFFLPDLFIFPFALQAEKEHFDSIQYMIEVLLKFVAVYCLFDAGNMIFSGALKGAGDTRFVAISSVVLSWVLMLIPSYITLRFFSGNIYWLWLFVTLYIAGLCVIFFWRFQKGRWKSMRVIETPLPEVEKSDLQI